MRSTPLLALSALLLASSVPALASPHVRRGPTAPRLHLFKAHSSKSAAHPAISRASSASHVGISSERATEIQTALIKSGYLSGTPSGTWDAQSQAAMEKLQADNGWQTKLVPDSRAIIKLGLGPGAPAATSSPRASLDPTQGSASTTDTFQTNSSNQ